MKEVLFRCRYFVGQSQISRGAEGCKSRIMSFTKAGMTFWSVKVLKHHDLRRMEAKEMGQKIYDNRRLNLGTMRIPYAGSKIIIFLTKKKRFLRNGEKWHVLGWPTIIIIKNY